MKEDLPIIVDGRTVARAIINHDRKQAMELAEAAAYHISTPNDIQFCTFSDGSWSNDPKQSRGGVGLVYRCKWLPKKWSPEQKATNHGGDTVEKTWPFGLAGMVHKAWPFDYAIEAAAMEGVGVLESLCAANEELKQHLPVLKQHTSTVMVKVITDCQEILQSVSKGTLTANQAKRLPPRLLSQMHDLIVEMQGHGITVVVELHWSPRNSVPQLIAADAIAGKAMKTGLGYCNVTQNLWSHASQSVTMRQLEPMLAGTVRFARLPPSQVSAGDGTVATEKETTKKKTIKKETVKETTKETTNGATKKETTKKTTTMETTTKETTTKETTIKKMRRGKKEAKRAQAAEMTTTGAANSHTQFPLPAAPLPSKPPPSKPPPSKPLPSKPPPSKSKASEPMPSNPMPPKAVPTSNNGQTTLSDKPAMMPSTKPAAASPPIAQPPKDPAEVQVGKRKVEENMSESEERPTKKSKPSLDPPTQEQQVPLTMPAAWGMDPETKVYIADPATGLFTETAVARAEWIRINPDSTLVTGETNVFISDGVSGFCVAKPKGITRQG